MALKVLTVDDSKTIRMIVKKAFQNYNCEIT
jgi:CheY-like chemotaxis protein